MKATWEAVAAASKSVTCRAVEPENPPVMMSAQQAPHEPSKVLLR